MESHSNFAVITTANTKKSFLTGCRSYTYDDPDIIKKLAATRAKVFNQLSPQSKYTLSNQMVTVVDYDPNILPTATDRDRTLHTDAKADKKNVADAWRDKTKHRSVTSRISCFADGFGEEVTPFFVIMTTGCSPNLMGSSPADEKTFSPNGQLDTKLYKETMKLLFKRWLMSQERFRVEAVVLPFIGGGVYLNKLDKIEQDKARQIILESLKEALEESSFKNIKEVIFATPDDKNGITANKSYRLAAKIFSSYSQQPGWPNLTVANIDIFDAANHIQQQGHVVGMINPGSDRTIGGAYQDTLDGKERAKITLEELICNYTDTAFIQSIDFNQQALKLKPYPQHLQAKNVSNISQSQAQITPTATSTALSVKNLAREIANRINTKETIWIFDSGNNKKISFKNEKDAARFVAQLQNMGIGSEKSPGHPKTVQNEKPYYVVYLSKNQISTLSQKLTAPQPSSHKQSWQPH